MTEKQKEYLKESKKFIEAGESRFGMRFYGQKRADELFPEAFAEPKPERESIDVRIERYNNHAGLDSDLIKFVLTSFNVTLGTEDEITVTELPAG